jgi:hypothetical protein
MDPVIDWLLQGDPAIRWQTLRDLVGAPAAEWQAEQRLTAQAGWGSQLLAQQDPASGGWGGGIYSPKWISTTYTLLSLRAIGIPPDCAPAQRGARLMLDHLLGPQRDAAFEQRLLDCDRCIVGMILQLCTYFGIEDERIDAVIQNILAEQMADGGWNCRKNRVPQTHHSSFHTTFNVLDGLREVLERGSSPWAAELGAAEAGALELLLQHRLFRSDHSGNIIRSEFKRLAYPFRWHYDILRGLDYFARLKAGRDPRLAEAISLLTECRQSDGRWPNQYKYSGKVFFDMERVGRSSRWNTLRALRVLKWWHSPEPAAQESAAAGGRAL